MGRASRSKMDSSTFFSGDAADAIAKATSAPGHYHFKELLDLPAVQALGSGDSAFETLNIFCFKTLQDYKAANLPPLSESQTQKLRLLTIVSMCGAAKVVPYAKLQEALDVSDVRELEDLVILAMEAGLVKGKMFHRELELCPSFTVGRDVHADETAHLLSKLTAWKAHSESVVAKMDEQVESGMKEYVDSKAADAEKAEEISKLKAEVVEGMKNQKNSTQSGLGFVMPRTRKGRHSAFRR